MKLIFLKFLNFLKVEAVKNLIEFLKRIQATQQDILVNSDRSIEYHVSIYSSNNLSAAKLKRKYMYYKMGRDGNFE